VWAEEEEEEYGWVGCIEIVKCIVDVDVVEIGLGNVNEDVKGERGVGVKGE